MAGGFPPVSGPRPFVLHGENFIPRTGPLEESDGKIVNN